MAKSFDKTVKRLCNKKISDPDAPILDSVFTVEQALAAAIIKKAMAGNSDAVKIIRDILSEERGIDGSFKVDISVVD